MTSTSPSIPTRDRLLTATNELFRRHGYHGTSLKQITAAAGAPTGSLYHFFPGGKDELTAAVLTTTGASYLALFELIAAEAGEPAVAVGDFFEGAAQVLEESDFIDPCPIGTVAREVASTNEPLRVAAEEVFASWIGGAEALLGRSGVPAAAATDLAFTIVAALEGGFILARARRDAEPLRAAGRGVRRLVEQALAAAPTALAGS